MSASDAKTITLMSSDNEMFEVDEAVAREFQIIAHMMEDGCADEPIPLENVTGKTLAKAIEYCKRHVEAGSVEGNEEAEAKLKEEDAEFVKQDIQELFELILAANYLNVKGLLDLTCQSIADHIKDKSVEEVRKIFHVVNDYTDEEEAQVRKENAWSFES